MKTKINFIIVFGFAILGIVANPEEHVKWYKDMGVNTIQTFIVSCNGYAWYKIAVLARVYNELPIEFIQKTDKNEK